MTTASEYKKNKQYYTKYNHTYYEKNSADVKKRSNAYYKSHLESGRLNRRFYYLRRCGVSEAEIARVAEALKKHTRCDICGVKKPGGRGEWHIDHDHVSKTFRGILCHKCNAGLGAFGDDFKKVQLAAVYLLRDKNRLENEK